MFSLVDLERPLSKFRLKNVHMEVGGKTFKQGEVVNWNVHDFYFEIILNTEKKEGDCLKFPPPFQFEFHGDDLDPELFLDYRISTLNKLGGFDFDPEEASLYNTHKFFNKIVVITT